MARNHELWYAEAKQGLDLSSTGFTTVKTTAGIPLRLKKRLEALSCYDTYSKNPHTRYCFTRFSDGGDTWFILSRANKATGYSKRAGFFCHHLAIHRSNRPSVNPAVVLGSQLMESKWDGVVEELSKCRSIGGVTGSNDADCRQWKVEFGDAGAAGEMLRVATKKKSVYLPVRDQKQILPMLKGALSVLPASRQWDISFTTYLTSDVERENCIVKCFPSPPPSHIVIPQGQVFSFSSDAWPEFDDNIPEEIVAARAGKSIAGPGAGAAPALPNDRQESALALAAEVPEKKGSPATGRRTSSSATRKPAEQVRKPATPPSMPATRSGQASTKGIDWTSILCGLVGGVVLSLLVAVPFFLSQKHRIEFAEATNLEVEEKLALQKTETREALNKLREANTEITILNGDIRDESDRNDKLAADNDKLTNELTIKSGDLEGARSEITRLEDLVEENDLLAKNLRQQLVEAIGAKVDEMAESDSRPESATETEETDEMVVFSEPPVVEKTLDRVLKDSGGFIEDALEFDVTERVLSMEFKDWSDNRSGGARDGGGFWQKVGNSASTERKSLTLFYDSQAFAEIKWRLIGEGPGKILVRWLTRKSADGTPWKNSDGELDPEFETSVIKKLSQSVLRVRTRSGNTELYSFNYPDSE